MTAPEFFKHKKNNGSRGSSQDRSQVWASIS